MSPSLLPTLLRSTLAGIAISTLFMAALYASALNGSHWAMNTMLKLTLPGFNMLANAVSDDAQFGRSVTPFLVAAWAQICVLLSLLIAVVSVLLAKSRNAT